jgi:ABC-type branched-subunit amino acid transport system substrate-binding protein
MKRSIWIVMSALLVASMLLTACGPGKPTTLPEVVEPTEVVVDDSPTPTEVAVVEPIVIGTSLPLTGEFSITGTKHQAGYQLCVDLINQAGGLLGRPVELIVSDNQSDVDTTLAQFERFINVDKVNLIFGTFSSKLTFPASAITELAKYLHPIPSAAALRVYERGFKYLVYFQPNAAEYIGHDAQRLGVC